MKPPPTNTPAPAAGEIARDWQGIRPRTGSTRAVLAAILLVVMLAGGLIFLWNKSRGFPPAAQPATPKQPATMQRYGSVIGLEPGKIDEYTALHAAVWPEVLAMIKECNISNYSIFLHQLDDGRYYLFSYFEYTGDDFAADMAKMAADPTTQRWWEFCKPCQRPLANRAEGEWWATMREVFHCD